MFMFRLSLNWSFIQYYYVIDMLVYYLDMVKTILSVVHQSLKLAKDCGITVLHLSKNDVSCNYVSTKACN